MKRLGEDTGLVSSPSRRDEPDSHQIISVRRPARDIDIVDISSRMAGPLDDVPILVAVAWIRNCFVTVEGESAIYLTKRCVLGTGSATVVDVVGDDHAA